MQTSSIRSFVGLAALVAVVAGGPGCVADRPSRNGVFNENQYLRKDFIVQPGDNGAGDPGWYMKTTVVQTSTPNPLAALDMFTGAENSGAIVRFAVTQDKLQLLDMRELSTTDQITAQQTRTPNLVNAWPVTNVDLKYRINLDGEKTNFYEENQELDWQVRQWVKINFAKNDLSDITTLGSMQALFLDKCANTVDASATLVPGSFLVDEPNNYMQWTVSITVPLLLNDEDCMQAFGAAAADFQRFGRSTVTMNVMYSFTRAKDLSKSTYVPLAVPEKDPILHKYGPIEITNYARDPQTGLRTARQLVLRYDPAKPIVWYFARGYPPEKKAMWTRAGGIVDQTNALFKAAGAQAQLSIKEFDDGGVVREYGDVRYNFIRWMSDLDTDSPFLAVTQFQPDLRTGELVSASINVADEPLKDFVTQRVTAYINKVLGVDPFSDPPPDPSDPVNKKLPGDCDPNNVDQNAIALVPAAVQKNIYGQSTLFQKMALYLPAPVDGASQPGPTDYIYQHTGSDGDAFYQAYYKLLPYITYADPLMNQFVTPADLSQPQAMQVLASTLKGERLFQKAISDVEHGQGLASLQLANGTAGMQAAYTAVDNMRQLWQAHRDYMYAWQLPHSLMRGDTPQLISFPQVVSRSSRRCVAGPGPNGGSNHWQTRDEWESALLASYYEGVVWHEFGHVMGLEHNFMGSIDKPNWPQYKDAKGNIQYGKLTSSIMEYSVTYDDTFWNNGSDQQGAALMTGWLPYDRGAISWIYGNNLTPQTMGPMTATGPTGISGQVSKTAPWNDPAGWKDDTTEREFLYCSHQHIRYTPLCREFDVGSTPAEITAADIELYEWNYKWRNFRNYYKVWDDSQYGSIVSNILNDSRRFISMWDWDWGSAELTDKLIRVGIKPASGVVNSGLFYGQLTNQFNSDVAAAEQMVAAFHEAIIQQGTGQRPFQTQYDPYFGDVTQQGISIDKELAFINWLGLWPYDNYDPTQAAGYLGSALVYGRGQLLGTGQTQPAQSWSAAASMLGEKGPWDAYPSFFPSAVSLFAHDTQSPTFTGMNYPQMRDWIGGHIFYRLPDVLSFFQNIAVLNPTAPNGCASLAACTYNPTTPATTASDIGHSNAITQAFIGPDNRRWTWVYLNDRNIWFFVDQDRNPSSYQQVLTYNTDVNTNYDDGNAGGPVYTYEARIKYMIDAFQLFGGDTTSQ